MNEEEYIKTELELENDFLIEVKFTRPFTVERDFDIVAFTSICDTSFYKDLEVCCKYDSNKFKPIGKFREKNQKRIIKAVENWLDENDPDFEVCGIKSVM